MLHWLTLSWLASPRFLIAGALGVLMCGQILWWRRRDNVLGYVLVATWVVTILVPLFGTSIVADSDPHVVRRLTAILLIGAGCYLVGLAAGGGIGGRSRLGRAVTWAHPFARDSVPPTIHSWARRFAVASLVVLAAAFALLGYVPLLAADRTSAKYGVGIYAAGAARGGAIYHIGLAMASVALPVILVIAWRRRSIRDLALCGAVLIGLLLTLSRQNAFSGPLLVVVAITVERRWKPVAVAALVCCSLFVGTLVNEFVFPSSPGETTPSFATRVAASAPDVHDQIGFLSGFQTLGNHFVGTKTLTAGFSAKKGYWDPGGYAVRTLTLLPDASGVGSGGIRLPAPEWGYSAFGWTGVVLWSLLSGLFAGWGTVTVKRLVSDSVYRPGGSLNYVLAWVFYAGTFGLLATFYFPERSGLLLLTAAVLFSYAGRSARQRRQREEVNAAFWA
ncbi:MAG: hypothetical protein QOK20_2189 [Acidimicrobiaceae bacterium]|nr:hypothetical protein [Acidimicrobiaceae bacterium]